MSKFNIDKALDQINKFFVDKILTEEFELVKVTKDRSIDLHIRIDNKPFLIWAWDNMNISTNNTNNVICLNFSRAQRKKVFKIATRLYDEHQRPQDEAKERIELKRLKEKYETPNV